MRPLVLLVLLGALLRSAAAVAGECSVDLMADELDARAKQASPKPASDDYHLCLWWDLPGVPTAQPKLAKRLLAACEKILTVRAADDLCVNVAAILGKDQLAKTDIIAALAARAHPIGDPHTIDFLGLTGSPRASPILVDLWKRLQPQADAKPDDSDLQNSWAAWRLSAASALGRVGDASARAFLADQIAHPIDRGVKRAAVAALKAIDSRSP